MSTLQTVKQLIADELAVDIATLDPARPLQDLGIDSLMLIECMFKIEDKFGISVATSESGINTLRDIATMIDRLVAENGLPEVA